MLDTITAAMYWDMAHHELPVSAFACRYPGQYKTAAEALRFARRLEAHTSGMGDDMSDHGELRELPPEERAKLYLAEKNAMRKDLEKTIELVAYYRELVPQNPSRAKPPTHYFVVPAKNWSYGQVRDGHLKMLGKDTGSEEDAIEACWAHFDEHISSKVETYIKKENLPKKAPPTPKKAVEEVDLSLDDDDDDDEPAPQPTRRRRRKVV